jgi:diaminohydroxyphosphoribosylaminopyrimidine deaminase/5-amino-6-(5-phosphoribosylamino)uracil reductase
LRAVAGIDTIPWMTEVEFMKRALRLARRGVGRTSPNPSVGAVLVKRGKVIGEGWHRNAGGDHAEIDAVRAAEHDGHSPRGATLYVTLEPCSTRGRTPACTDAIRAAGITRVVVGTADPNPDHSGRAFAILRRAGIEANRITSIHRHNAKLDRASLKAIAADCAALNEPFNHWIVRRTPFVTVKAAMTLDGKIATQSGESKWITGARARNYGMRLRRASDAILVGINTVLADDPSLTVRAPGARGTLRRIILDSRARTPLAARVVSDSQSALTTVVVSHQAPAARVAALRDRVRVLVAPRRGAGTRTQRPVIDLRWLLQRLGREEVTSLLVEGGGEVNASFLLGGLAHRVAFFYAPRILGGRDARTGVAGEGARRLSEVLQLDDIQWRTLGSDLLLAARVKEARTPRVR